MLTGDEYDIFEDSDSYNFTTPDTKIKWGPWKKKFAFLPTTLHSRLDGYNTVWFASYYERSGQSLYMTTRQRGTLLDVIKETE